MSQLFWAGTGCWVICCLLGSLFQYESRNKMTLKGMILKAVAAFSVVGYALTLIILFGKFSDASINFVVGLLLVTIGDTFVAYLEYKGDGTSDSVIQAVKGNNRKGQVFLCATGVLYILSYFLQMVAFIKGIAQFAHPTDYVVPFIVLFFLPPIFTVLGGLLSKFRVPDIELYVFIIGIFYILLTSALFAAASVFAFSLFTTDPIHAALIFFGAVVFFLSMLMVELRYANSSKYEGKVMRMASRLLTFLGRMILAGCAFLL